MHELSEAKYAKISFVLECSNVRIIIVSPCQQCVMNNQIVHMEKMRVLVWTLFAMAHLNVGVSPSVSGGIKYAMAI